MEAVRTNGLEVAYRRVGEGPPLLFVHGGAGDGRMWQPQLDALSDAFTVVAWDEPGAGRSSPLPDGFGLPDYARCLAALIDALALGPAHVVGISWGGTLALELYRGRPDLIATLVLAGAYAGWKGSLPEAEIRTRLAGARRMLDAPPGRFDPTLPGLFAGDVPSEFVALLKAVAADVRRESLRTELWTMAETDQCDLLPRIAVPTLLVWGELDARSPLDVAHQFEQAIPHAELVTIPGCGHVSNLEAPAPFNAAVRAFCLAHATSATPLLQALLDAFNAHDVDAIMACFTEDCVFDTPRGPAPGGRRLVGKEQVREGFKARFDGIPDIEYGDDRHWTSGDRGVSEWTIRGTQASGEPIEVRGCDLFEFTDGRISRKDSYWKIVD